MKQKVVIVGGVAGGAGTAARLRRLDETAEIVLFERGDYISFANCGLPYYIGDVIRERENLLVMKAELMAGRVSLPGTGKRHGTEGFCSKSVPIHSPLLASPGYTLPPEKLPARFPADFLPFPNR